MSDQNNQMAVDMDLDIENFTLSAVDLAYDRYSSGVVQYMDEDRLIVYGSGDDDDTILGDDGKVSTAAAVGTPLIGGPKIDVFDAGSGDEDGFASDVIHAGYGDTIVNVDAFDTIYFEDRRLTGGWRLAMDAEDQPRSGSYDGDDGLLYVFDRAARTLTVSDGTGSLTITGYDNEGYYGYDGGIWLGEYSIMM